MYTEYEDFTWSTEMYMYKLVRELQAFYELQYRSDARYKPNAFIASDEHVYRCQQTRLMLMMNVFIA